MLLGLNLLPAVIVGGVMVLVGLDELPDRLRASTRPRRRCCSGIFVASQAPVLFSRDLRHGTISLYLARPLPSDTYAIARWASLLGATLVFLLSPDPRSCTPWRCWVSSTSPTRPREAAVAIGLAVLLALSLTGVAGLIASWSTRRGFAVVATIALLLLGNGIVTAIQAIAGEEGHAAGRRGRRAVLAVLALPRAAWPRGPTRDAPTPPTGAADAGRLRRGVRRPVRGAAWRGLVWRYRTGGDGMSTITIDKASRWYGNVVAVNGISMTVRPGVTGLLGPNGAGKTTLIALMSGFLAPSAGTVTLDGQPIWRHTDAYRTIGLVPERELSFGYLTGRQFVLANAELHGLADPGAATERALEVVEMTEPAARRIGTYSKGMRQRVKLASALVHDPAVLLLDEPFNGVDPRQRLHLMTLLRQMGAEGRTVLFSSHILEEVEQVARQIEVVVSGRHAASGDFGQIRRLMTDRPVQYVVVG